MNMEIVYNQMLRGVTDREQIKERTGLSLEQIQHALANLHKKKRISVERVIKKRNSPYNIYTLNPQAPKRNIFSNVNSIFNVRA